MAANAAPAPTKDIDYSSPQGLLLHGHEVLHENYAARVEKALGRALPQMEVRAKNLSLVHHVVVGKKETLAKPILHEFSGVFQPGTMTLVLGQPGSGKSSLLKVLGGRFPLSKTVTMDGEIEYNGVTQRAFGTRLPQFVSYTGQRDRHFPRLTVKETLAFAHECAGSELSEHDEQLFLGDATAESKAALEAARALYRHYPEVITKQLALEDCEDTIVGDNMLRGVSGGQRKRVTTGEMAFGDKFVALMDEISTGLDSAATFSIVKTQRSLAQKLRKTVVMALLQPAPEVFALFDFVVVLNEGHVMYHGPREQVVPYFESLGFLRPADRDVADYLLDLGTEQQVRYEVGSPSHLAKIPRKPADFADAFRQSATFARMMDELHGPLEATLAHDVERHFERVPEFHQDFSSGTWSVMKRDFKVAWRNTPYILGRLIVLFLVAMIYSTLIYDFDPKNVQTVIGTIFPTILFFALGQTAQLPLFLDAREVFYKQRAANMYRTSSYVVSTAINQLPIAFVEVAIMGVISYWLCGFVAELSRFLVFEVILFTTYLAFVGWYFLISAATPNIQVAQPLASMSMLIFVVFSGFVITHQDIPDYFVWLYWLNPIAWGVRAMAINQYGHSSFDTCVYDGIDYCGQFGKRMGDASLDIFDIYTESYWIWLGIAVVVAMFVIFMALGGYALENMRFEPPSSATSEAPTSTAEPPTIDEDAYRSGDTPRSVALDVAPRTRSFTPVTLAFKDLWYSVPDPSNSKQQLELLKGVSGVAKPGTITALMGASGAGKTTLMDVIAGRKTGGTIRGEVLLNGHPATDLAIRRATGYCEQMDVHAEATTFREALVFSAFLRQGTEITDAQKYDSVEECLDLLDLRPIADKLVRGSSVEQMKRLTIGVELAAQPSILFLDEPTSGLDARSAKMVMEGIRKVADTGRTIVCTIHQPSADVFSVFDSLLLLKRGGEVVYFGELGENASQLIRYFETIDGVPHLEASYNPATWMLEVIGSGTDFVAVFKRSEKRAALEHELEVPGVGQPALDDGGALTFRGKRAATELTQAQRLMHRFADMYWRTPDYVVARLAVNIVLGVILGLTFLNADVTTYHGINAGVGMIFSTMVFVGGVSFDTVRPITIQSRDIFYRERASQTYNALWYFLGGSLIEIPYVFGSTFAFVAIFFPLVGFTGVLRFLLYWFAMSTFVLIQTYLGQLLVFVLPSLEVAATFSILLTAIFFLFGGFNPTPSAIPSTHRWIYQLTPASYPLMILSSLVFGECSLDTPSDTGCQTIQGAPPTLPQGLTIKTYLETVFEIKRDELWSNYAVMLAFIVAIRLLALLALRFINHQKK